MKDFVCIENIDLYRFLIGNLRYAYTRNNHLQPQCIYDEIKEKFLPKFFESDQELALHTAKQMCEECISTELMQFLGGEEDEFGNEKASVVFVEELLGTIHLYQPEYLPYNYDSYLNILRQYEEKVYNIYEITSEDDLPHEKPLYTSLNSLELFDYIIKALGVSKEQMKKGVIYNKQRFTSFREFCDFKYTFSFPNNKVFYVENVKNRHIQGEKVND